MTDPKNLTQAERDTLQHEQDMRRHAKAAFHAANAALSDLAHLDEMPDPLKRAEYVRHWSEVTLERLRKATAETHKAVEMAKRTLGETE